MTTIRLKRKYRVVIRCGACDREWPDVIEPTPGVTYCECGAILVTVRAVPRAEIEAIWGPSIPPPA